VKNLKFNNSKLWKIQKFEILLISKFKILKNQKFKNSRFWKIEILKIFLKFINSKLWGNQKIKNS